MTKMDPKWPDGPWDDELDFDEWEAFGLLCRMRRHRVTGSLCGYVVLPAGHPATGLSHGLTDGQPEGYEDVSPHGGITYAEAEGDTWVVGFDTGHSCDKAPGMQAMFAGWPAEGGTYRDWAYVRNECEQMAKVLSITSKAGTAAKRLAQDLDVAVAVDQQAKAEVERSLYEAGIIEDPDVDGGLLG